MGSVGDCYDNALAETINGLYKAEVIHRRGPWRCFEAVEFATLEWVDWFNNRRLLEPIGNIPPAEAEERYYAMLEDPDMAALLKRNGLRKTRGGSAKYPPFDKTEIKVSFIAKMIFEINSVIWAIKGDMTGMEIADTFVADHKI